MVRSLSDYYYYSYYSKMMPHVAPLVVFEIQCHNWQQTFGSLPYSSTK